MTIFGAGREDHGIKGFSLIEVFIVIVVAAILMTIANSMFTASGKNTNLREAAGALVEDIKLAKGRAVSESVKYTITFDVDNNTYTINKLDPNDTTDSTIISSTTRTLGEFGNGIIISKDEQNKITYTGNKITFQVRGTCCMGSITLENSLKSKVKITTYLTGRVKTANTIKYI